MGIAYVNGQLKTLAARALLLLPLSLGGCATSAGGSSQMDARAEAPAPRTTSGYPSLEVLPPPNDREIMTADKRSKLEKELTAARDRQAAAVKAKAGAPQAVQPTTQTDRQ